jgi:predicted DNA binding CopG/RHH family protein
MNEPIFNLTPEELEMEAEFERGEWTSVPNLEEEKKRFQEIARNTIAKNKVITVRLSEKNLIKVKAAAAREGIPYQTFITSLIHKNT